MCFHILERVTQRVYERRFFYPGFTWDLFFYFFSLKSLASRIYSRQFIRSDTVYLSLWFSFFGFKQAPSVTALTRVIKRDTDLSFLLKNSKKSDWKKTIDSYNSSYKTVHKFKTFLLRKCWGKFYAEHRK